MRKEYRNNLHTPTSKVGNTIFDISLFENRKIVRSKMWQDQILQNLIWCFLMKTYNIGFLESQVGDQKWGIVSQDKIIYFNG